ncbi:MAG TPA: amino acid--tRNA ligase-related protein, partial [Acidobacteriota bacterium]|nr:amino acid--tRNA ligase-related protein [Acidobacteriota bacterium]
MENYTNLLEQRKFKLAELKRLGYDPYPRKYEYTHTLGQIREIFDSLDADQLKEINNTVRICGRIMSLRPHGKAGFMDLSDGENRIQVYVRQDIAGSESFELFRLFDLGDIVGASGTIFRTRTKELTVLASGVSHLSKNLLPLPEKWHGLTDVETRFRRRYVDLIVNPEVRRVFTKRTGIIRETRKFLDSRGYMEVETPVLQPIAGGALARPFRTHHKALDLNLYLRIALELYLKRLVAGGMPRVYELSRIFRNEGISSHHNPEFTMLEFYQAYSDYNDLMDLSREMITHIAETVAGTRQVTYGEHVLDFDAWQRYSMKEAIRHFWPGPMPAPSDGDLQSVETLRRLAQSIDGRFEPSDGPGKLQATLFETVAEDHLIQPTIIHDYP